MARQLADGVGVSTILTAMVIGRSFPKTRPMGLPRTSQTCSGQIQPISPLSTHSFHSPPRSASLFGSLRHGVAMSMAATMAHRSCLTRAPHIPSVASSVNGTPSIRSSLAETAIDIGTRGPWPTCRRARVSTNYQSKTSDRSTSQWREVCRKGSKRRKPLYNWPVPKGTRRS